MYGSVLDAVDALASCAGEGRPQRASYRGDNLRGSIRKSSTPRFAVLVQAFAAARWISSEICVLKFT